MTKTPTDLDATVADLTAQLRAARRAARTARREALLAARQDLGVWLAEAAGADTPEAVARLRDALDPGQLRAAITAAPEPGDGHHDDGADAGY